MINIPIIISFGYNVQYLEFIIGEEMDFCRRWLKNTGGGLGGLFVEEVKWIFLQKFCRLICVDNIGGYLVDEFVNFVDKILDSFCKSFLLIIRRYLDDFCGYLLVIF